MIEAGASPEALLEFFPVFKPNARLLLLILAAFSGACSSVPTAQRHQANINHVVLVTLKNDADSDALIKDCDAWLLSIPDVSSYWAGTPLDIGRGESIDSDYSVGLCVGFDDIAGYKAYLEHPLHVKLVEKWKPKWSSVRMFDVISNP